MQLIDVQTLLNNGHPLRHPVAAFASDGAFLVVSGRIAYPVFPVQRSLAGGPDIPIVEPGGGGLGTLVLSSRLPVADPATFTDDQYVAYLTEATIDQVGANYRFRDDYVVITHADRARYEGSFLSTSGLWGGFIHVKNPRQEPKVSANPTASITALDNLELPTTFHEENLFRSSQVAFAFERYLKLYHLLELMFDWYVVEKIKALGPDLQGIGEVMSRYSSKELPRLRWLIEETVPDPGPIAHVLNNLPPHMALAEKVFFDFGKEGNPFADIGEVTTVQGHGGFQFASIKAWRPKATALTHRKLILDIASYWIYRIRCCIAHSRIGEYVMTHADEDFVIEFGEPLLRAVLLQVFHK